VLAVEEPFYVVVHMHPVTGAITQIVEEDNSTSGKDRTFSHLVVMPSTGGSHLQLARADFSSGAPLEYVPVKERTSTGLWEVSSVHNEVALTVNVQPRAQGEEGNVDTHGSNDEADGSYTLPRQQNV
jgi:hypothetical protein